MLLRLVTAGALTVVVATIALAQGTLVVEVPPEGSVTRDVGLAAWERIYAVASHPRCVNCHTDETNLPMWSGPTYGEPRVHGMNINAGDSRIGAEGLSCKSCHMTSTRPNVVPHAAPHTGVLGNSPRRLSHGLARTAPRSAPSCATPAAMAVGMVPDWWTISSTTTK